MKLSEKEREILLEDFKILYITPTKEEFYLIFNDLKNYWKILLKDKYKKVIIN